MRRETPPKSKRKEILTIAFSVLAFFAILFSFFISESSTQDSSALLVEDTVSQSTQKQANIELPTRLNIPSINVDASVEYVGLTPDGAMDVPKEPANAAWFNLGSRPGESGSAVIAGHYGWKNDIPAVFDNLHKLRKGDKLYIEDEKGEIITFVVRESRRYDPDARPPEVFSSSDGKAHLNLVTCEGEWNDSARRYSERLVVFTEKE